MMACLSVADETGDENLYSLEEIQIGQFQPESGFTL
jgi:hypothetical protein